MKQNKGEINYCIWGASKKEDRRKEIKGGSTQFSIDNTYSL